MNEGDVATILRRGFEAVMAADLPTEVRGVALGKAVDLLARAQHEAPALMKEHQGRPSGAVPGDVLSKIATKFGVDRELVDDGFDVRDGAVTLAVSRTKLDAAKSKATKQIALLVASGRQAAELEDSTDTKVIRTVVDEYGKLDGPNFASTIAELGDSFKMTGSKYARVLTARRAAFDDAGKLLTALVRPTASK